MKKLFIRITDWIKGKDPNTLVDIASPVGCIGCEVKNIPGKYRELLVWTEQVAPVAECLYVSTALKETHKDDQSAYLLDLENTITLRMAIIIIMAKGDPKEINQILSFWDKHKERYEQLLQRGQRLFFSVGKIKSEHDPVYWEDVYSLKAHIDF